MKLIIWLRQRHDRFTRTDGNSRSWFTFQPTDKNPILKTLQNVFDCNIKQTINERCSWIYKAASDREQNGVDIHQSLCGIHLLGFVRLYITKIYVGHVTFSKLLSDIKNVKLLNTFKMHIQIKLHIHILNTRYIINHLRKLLKTYFSITLTTRTRDSDETKNVPLRSGHYKDLNVRLVRCRVVNAIRIARVRWINQNVRHSGTPPATVDWPCAI